jgi:hypothetical protein
METKFMECPEVSVVEDTGTADIAVDASVPDGTAQEATGPAGWVGTACAEDTECAPGTCFTKEFLEGLGVQIDNLEVTNGMCSMMFCPDDSGCGQDGYCYDTSSWTGTPISICLRKCVDMVDCRWMEGYTCFYEKPEDEFGACLPDSIVVAILCNDGHCDAE